MGWFWETAANVLGGVFFAGSPASQTFCAAKSRRRGDSFAPSKRNRRRVSAQRARTQQSRLLGGRAKWHVIRSVAQNCHRRNSFPPLNDKIGTEVCLAHRRSSKRLPKRSRMGVKKRKSSMPASAYVDIQRKNKNARSPNPSQRIYCVPAGTVCNEKYQHEDDDHYYNPATAEPLPPPLLPPDPPLVLLNA